MLNFFCVGVIMYSNFIFVLPKYKNMKKKSRNFRKSAEIFSIALSAQSVKTKNVEFKYSEKAAKMWPIFHFLFDITKGQILYLVFAS